MWTGKPLAVLLRASFSVRGVVYGYMSWQHEVSEWFWALKNSHDYVRLFDLKIKFKKKKKKKKKKVEYDQNDKTFAKWSV
jgi:hypothetical protein